MRNIASEAGVLTARRANYKIREIEFAFYGYRRKFRSPKNQKMRGRKPKPIAQQIAEGDPRKHGVHKLEEKLAAEPKATRGLPACPRHLKGRARSAWTFWVAELSAMGIDRRPDAQMLEGACVNYARAVQADLEIERDGITVKESYVEPESGEVIVLKIRKHPAVEVANAAWLRLHKFASEFGLSPVSRLRLATEKQDQPVDDLAEMLSRPRAPRPPPAPVVN